MVRHLLASLVLTSLCWTMPAAAQQKENTGPDQAQSEKAKEQPSQSEKAKEQPSQSQKAAQTAPTQIRRMARVSYVPGSLALPVIVAQERGFFAKNGIVVSALPVTDQRAVTTSLVQGYTDLAVGPQIWLLDAALSKAPVKVVALAGYEKQIQLIEPVWAPKSEGVKGLKGKTLLVLRGSHQFDVLPEMYRLIALSKMRLSDVEVDFINVDDLPKVLDKKAQGLYKKRKIGGILAPVEFTYNFVDDKKARVVLSNEEIKKVIGRISPLPLLASDKTIKEQPELVQRFVTAWVEAMKHIESDPADAKNLLALYYYRQFGVQLSSKDAERYLEFVKYDRYEWTKSDIRAVGINGKALSAARNILFTRIKDPKKRPYQKAPDVDAMVDNSFVEKAVKSLDSAPKAAPAPDAKTDTKPDAEKEPAAKAPATDKEKPE